MRRVRIALAVVLALVGPASAGIIFDGGSPNLVNGNEATYWVQAEDFVLREAAELTDGHFWTLEQLDAWDGALRYYLFADVGGNPAAAPFASGNGINVVKTATGRTYGGMLTEYEYSFDLATAVGLSPGTTYWFAMHLSGDWNRDEIYWEMGSPGFGQTGHESLNGTFVNWYDNGADHAFNLTGGAIPEPATLSLLGAGLLVAAWRRRRR